MFFIIKSLWAFFWEFFFPKKSFREVKKNDKKSILLLVLFFVCLTYSIFSTKRAITIGREYLEYKRNVAEICNSMNDNEEDKHTSRNQENVIPNFNPVSSGETPVGNESTIPYRDDVAGETKKEEVVPGNRRDELLELLGE